MSGTAGRLLALLALLASPTGATSAELARKLGVSTRTIRNDIERLRQLEYPVDAGRGPAGGYRLGAGGKLPPLMLDDEEAVAVAIGLRTATGLVDVEHASARALTKLEQVLPAHLRPTVQAIAMVVDHAPENNDTDADDPEADPAVLAALAAAIHASEWVRFDYRGHDRAALAEPYRLVAWQRRWYLIGRDPASGVWATFRVDWMSLRPPTRRPFAPTPVPGGDFTAYAMRSIAASGWQVHARFRIAASAERVLDRINPAVGMVESVSADECLLISGADSLDTLAAYIGMLGMDFTVESPAELRSVLRTYAARYLRAIVDTSVVRHDAADEISRTDEERLRRCVQLAEQALAAGDDPFGSVLTDASGAVLAEAVNRETTDQDPIAHPEFALVRWAIAHLTPEQRATSTVYTSGEHCPLCAAAHGWAGMGRVVAAASAAQLAEWRTGWGLPAGPVAPIPLAEVVPGISVIAPVPPFDALMREVHERGLRDRGMVGRDIGTDNWLL